MKPASPLAIALLFLVSFATSAYSETTTITFDEISTCDRRNPPPYGPPCVEITDQYIDQGVIFIPVPYNPISIWEQTTLLDPPYLIGSYDHSGDILVRFVDEDDQSTYVSRKNVQFLAGGFDNIGTVSVSWLDTVGTVISTQTNQTKFPDSPYYEPMIAPGPVGGFRIGINCGTINCETEGYDIDNIQFGESTFCVNDGDPHCNHNPSEDKDLGCNSFNVGNPCNPATGNKYQREIDFDGATISFSRHYNSGLSMDIGLGFGWTSNFHKRIEHYADRKVRARRADGRSEPFWMSGGEWSSYDDSTSTLIENSTGYTLTLENKTVEIYDLAGRILSETTLKGQSITYSYSASTGLLEHVTDSFGNSAYFVHVNGRLQSFEDPAGRMKTYSYDTAGNLSSVTDSMAAVRSYHYEDPRFPHHLTGITDKESNRFATWSYNENGRVISSEHAGGVNKVTLSYIDDDRTNVTDSFGTSRIYSFDKRLGSIKYTGMSEPCYGCDNAAKKTYDINGNVNSTTDFEGNLTCYDYDRDRNLETVRVEGFAPTTTACPWPLEEYTPTPGTLERKIVTTWHDSFPLPVSIERPNITEEFKYDSQGNVLTKKFIDTTQNKKVNREWNYTYDEFGRLLTEDGPRRDVNDLTSYTYHQCNSGGHCGQLHTITNPLGQVITYDTYNANGQPLSIIDPSGTVTTLTYDSELRLTSKTVGNENTLIEYWPTGMVRKLTLPNGSYFLFTYDNAHRLTKVQDGAGNYIEYTLDAMGNRTNESILDPTNYLSRTYETTYNSLNQLSQRIGAAATAGVTTVFGYDRNGNLTNVDAPLDRNTLYSYDALGRLELFRDPANGQTSFGYDANDNLIRVSDPRNLETSFSYTGFGDLAMRVSPDTGTKTYSYDSAGNLGTTTDARGVTSTYTYDDLNRVKTATHKIKRTIDQEIALTYDAGTYGAGRLTGASDSNHSLAFTYDEHGRVASKEQTIGSVEKSVLYLHDAGQLRIMEMPSGQQVIYDYDANGRLSSLTLGSETILSDIQYDPFGPVSGWTWGNATTATRTYDRDGNFSQIDSAGTKTYSYDDGFRITGIDDAGAPGNSYTYSYDRLDRLTSASKTGMSIGWIYDSNGNRLNQSGWQAATSTIDPDSNKILSISGGLEHTYSYDDTGNVISDASAAFTYNYRGRLTSMTKSGVTATYEYDAFGQRIKKNGGSSGTVIFMYDEAGHLIGEYDENGALIQETVWLGDIPVATLRPNGGTVEIYYVHTDHLNSPMRITRPSDNALMWEWNASPFGSNQPNENPGGFGFFNYNLRFPGQYYDSETGFHYNYYRDYDPKSGRYIQADPRGILLDFSDPLRQVAKIGVPIPFNKQLGYLNHNYNYSDSNPITGFDPTGENTLVGMGWGFSVGGPPGAVVGGFIGTGIVVGTYLMCASEDGPEPSKKNCEALKQSILNTCYGLTGRKRIRCFEAANTAFRQCMGYE